jgi:hypothetical protein
MKLSSVSKHHDIYILHGVKSQGLQTLNIVDSFAELRKATIIVFMSVRLSAWKNSASTGLIFIKFEI